MLFFLLFIIIQLQHGAHDDQGFAAQYSVLHCPQIFFFYNTYFKKHGNFKQHKASSNVAGYEEANHEHAHCTLTRRPLGHGNWSPALDRIHLDIKQFVRGKITMNISSCSIK